MKGEWGGGDPRSFTEQQSSPPWSFRSARRSASRKERAGVWAGIGLRCHPAEAPGGDGQQAEGSRTAPSLWAAEVPARLLEEEPHSSSQHCPVPLPEPHSMVLRPFSRDKPMILESFHYLLIQEQTHTMEPPFLAGNGSTNPIPCYCPRRRAMHRLCPGR